MPPFHELNRIEVVHGGSRIDGSCVIHFRRQVVGVDHDASGAVILKTQTTGLSGVVKHLSMQKHLTLPTVSADINGQILAGDAHANVSCSTCSIQYTPTLDLALTVDKGN